MDLASGNPLVTALLVGVLLVLVVARQLTDRPTPRRAMFVPLVLTVLGVLTLLVLRARVAAAAGVDGAGSPRARIGG
ncbi:hypothetical protein GCM10010472_36240 [Pseudonocardia halophobica]|uniref:Uncharacterized protein n=1 Tax=Pseudonocardia halophobica TaxID=29401 RepID=A0A9W6L848_9PSEU|nr:hypothetical protein [Pseudonocardia halophobica]GLL14610.1 hypothetical protein GCM10017577_57580 [Pseudonocardia halophobica]